MMPRETQSASGSRLTSSQLLGALGKLSNPLRHHVELPDQLDSEIVDGGEVIARHPSPIVRGRMSGLVADESDAVGDSLQVVTHVETRDPVTQTAFGLSFVAREEIDGATARQRSGTDRAAGLADGHFDERLPDGRRRFFDLSGDGHRPDCSHLVGLAPGAPSPLDGDGFVAALAPKDSDNRLTSVLDRARGHVKEAPEGPAARARGAEVVELHDFTRPDRLTPCHTNAQSSPRSAGAGENSRSGGAGSDRQVAPPQGGVARNPRCQVSRTVYGFRGRGPTFFPEVVA